MGEHSSFPFIMIVVTVIMGGVIMLFPGLIGDIQDSIVETEIVGAVGEVTKGDNVTDKIAVDTKEEKPVPAEPTQEAQEELTAEDLQKLLQGGLRILAVVALTLMGLVGILYISAYWRAITRAVVQTVQTILKIIAKLFHKEKGVAKITAAMTGVSILLLKNREGNLDKGGSQLYEDVSNLIDILEETHELQAYMSLYATYEEILTTLKTTIEESIELAGDLPDIIEARAEGILAEFLSDVHEKYKDEQELHSKKVNEALDVLAGGLDVDKDYIRTHRKTWKRLTGDEAPFNVDEDIARMIKELRDGNNK